MSKMTEIGVFQLVATHRRSAQRHTARIDHGHNLAFGEQQQPQQRAKMLLRKLIVGAWIQFVSNVISCLMIKWCS